MEIKSAENEKKKFTYNCIFFKERKVRHYFRSYSIFCCPLSPFLMNEPCGAELEAIVACSRNWLCKMKVVEKRYVNCVLQQICPLETLSLIRSNCVNSGTLDLRKGASDECVAMWSDMDNCLVRATSSEFEHQLSQLAPRK